MRLSADDKWLRSMWPRVQRAMDWAIEVSGGDGDGVLQVGQPSTHGCPILGANTFNGAQEVAVLRAAEAMALPVGDTAAARRYQAVLGSGAAAMDRRLWNRKWWVQALDPREPPSDQYGTGCHSDPLQGQCWALVDDPGHVLPRCRVRAALGSVFRHNSLTSFGGFRWLPRVFASNDEMGLICCWWPLGGGPPGVTLHSDEVCAGIEYEVAALLLQEGTVPEAYHITKGARDPHGGSRRSPWDETERSGHHARAMSRYALLLAAEGYRYNGPGRVLRFASKSQPGDLRAFLTGAEG